MKIEIGCLEFEIDDDGDLSITGDYTDHVYKYQIPALIEFLIDNTNYVKLVGTSSVNTITLDGKGV